MHSPCVRFLGFTLALTLAPMIASADPLKTPAVGSSTEQRIERIVCRANPDQSYALFLPSGYDPAKRWPVLFCFDPAAKGDRPVRLFAAAAEKHGYIVVGSYNSRNGPMAVGEAAADAMLRDVSARFSVDRRRVYLAGFSGGARMATHVAGTGLAQGVIACGGGFMTETLTPDHVPFDFCGFAGTEDFNRGELERIDQDLNGEPVAHRLRLFPGGHAWLPASMTDEALGWLDAQDRHAGIRLRYRAHVRAALQERQQSAARLPPVESYLEYAALVADGKMWMDVREARQQKRRLESAPEVRGPGPEAERSRDAMVDDWMRRAGRTADPSARVTLSEWLQQAAEGDSPRSRLARRALASASLQCCGRAAVSLADRGPNPLAVHWAALAAEAAPEQPLLTYNLACVAALADRPAEALAALRQAVGSGFKNASEAAQDPALAALRTNPEFEALLADMDR